MNILASYEWIREYLKTDADARKFADEMSVKSMSVERMDDVAGRFQHIVVGRVEEVMAHPNADKLKVAVVDVGEAYDGSGDAVEIVCGGVNLAQGQKVVVALPGAKVRWHGEGELVTLEETKIRGVASCGMICAPEEIGFEKAECPPGGIWDVSTLLVDAEAGTAFADAFELHDTIFDIEITTNRPDVMSIVGLAREASVAVGGTFVAPGVPDILGGEGLSLEVRVEDGELCPRYMAVAVDSVNVGPSPAWLQKRLLLSGHRPINSVVDVTNYVLHEYGQPMHAFDYDKIKGALVVRKAHDGEKMVALDGIEYALSAGQLVIADNEGPVAIAGVMGGLRTGVTMDTKRIIFESATFDEVSVRKTARSLNLYSDSQLLFEKGLSTKSPERALARAVELVRKLCGGSVASPVVDVWAQEYVAPVFTFDPERARALIGVSLETMQMLTMLESLGFTVREKMGECYAVEVPFWRDKDIENDVDLIEEVARMYGYINLPSALPESAPPGAFVKADLVAEDEVRRLLQSAGYTEFYSYSFVSEGQLTAYDIAPDGAMKILNPLSSDLTHLRPSLIPSLLTGIEENQRRVEHAKVFELARVYIPKVHDLPEEKTHLVIAQFGDISAREAFLELKGLVEEMFHWHGLTPGFERLEEDPYWHTTRSASILMNGMRVGEIGQIEKKYQISFGIDRPVMVARLDLSLVPFSITKHRVYRAFSEIQPVVRDIAVVVNRELSFSDVSKTVLASHELVAKVALSDEYTGDPIPSDKKSITLTVTLQPMNTSLSSEEIESVLSTIAKTLEQSFHATIR